MKTTGAQSTVDRFFPQAKFDELPAPHRPVLAVCQLHQPTIVSASPREPLLKTG